MENQEESNVTETKIETENKDQNQTYTFEEVQKLLQTETDRKVTSALKKQADKYEKKLSLSKLDGDERDKAEKDQRIQELQEQLSTFQVEKNKSELKSVLSSRGLSAEFADIIAINDDIETSQKNIDTLDKLFKLAVKAEVEKRLASNSPKENIGNKEALTKSDIKKMSLTEMTKLQEQNPELFNKYFN